jgi:hypothetical protein
VLLLHLSAVQLAQPVNEVGRPERAGVDCGVFAADIMEEGAAEGGIRKRRNVLIAIR